MNAGAIILGVVIIVLCYILYIFITKQDTYILSSSKDISGGFQPQNSNTYVPTANTFAYGIWVYVGNWDDKDKTILTMISDSRKNSLSIGLEKKNPILFVNFGSNTGGNVSVMNNFPLQKWVYIIVSVDNQYLDVYIDGKLVRSILLQNSVIMYNNNTDNNSLSIKAGPCNNTIITYFNVWLASAVDPGTAWKYYMKGNGQSSVTGYGANLQIVQNNAVQGTYQLF